jgi:hypothetical protein
MSCKCVPGAGAHVQSAKLTLVKFRHQIYFEKIHPSVPMIHKYRYLAAMNLYAWPLLSSLVPELTSK